MKRILLIIFYTTCFLLLFQNGCSENSNPITDETYDFSIIIKDYTEKVVIATYEDLMNKAAELQTACENYKNDPTQENLDIAANAWVAAREPWEASEGFLFGPVSFLGLDPSLDTWPLDETQLTNVLNSSFELSPEFIKNGLGPELRGFHAIEYSLFINGQHRTNQLTERERDYLVSASVVLAEDAEQLYQAWAAGFGDEFKNAGNSGSRYSSQNQAILESVEGIIAIADEVGNGKIGDPYNTKDVLSVESQFSWNSLTDFANNIRSIRNAYIGNYKNINNGNGLEEFIKSINPQLDTRILSEIDAAITAIENIPEPFRNNLNADIEIQTAITACNKILVTFEADVKPLINQ